MSVLYNSCAAKIQVSGVWKQWRKDIENAVDLLIKYLKGFNVDLNSLSKNASVFFESLSSKFQHPFEENLILLIEDNFYYRGMRYEWYQLARKHSAGFFQILLECDLKLALQRNHQRSNKVPDHVVESVYEKMEHPEPDKHSWEADTLKVDTQTELKEILTQLSDGIQKSLTNPLSPLEIEDPSIKQQMQRTCSRNCIHQIDNVLRKLVGLKITQGLKSKSWPSEVNKSKQEILQGIKNGKLLVSEELISKIESGLLEEIQDKLEVELSLLLDTALINNDIDNLTL